MNFNFSDYSSRLFDSRATVVGAVFRAGLKELLEKHFTEVKPGENSKILADTVTAPHICFYGIRVFFDTNQVEDCLMFEDKELLELYLNRRSNEEFKILIRTKSAINSEPKFIPPQDYPLSGWQ
jgi:hypothetical protein